MDWLDKVWPPDEELFVKTDKGFVKSDTLVGILRKARYKMLVAIRPLGPAREAFDLVVDEFTSGMTLEAREAFRSAVYCKREEK